jgi:hypothetical protein
MKRSPDNLPLSKLLFCTVMEALFTAANMLNLSTHFVKNKLLVRALSLLGALTLTIFAISRPQPWIHAICWNLVYVFLNAAKLWQLRRSYGDCGV